MITTAEEARLHTGNPDRAANGSPAQERNFSPARLGKKG